MKLDEQYFNFIKKSIHQTNYRWVSTCKPYDYVLYYILRFCLVVLVFFYLIKLTKKFYNTKKSVFKLLSMKSWNELFTFP